MQGQSNPQIAGIAAVLIFDFILKWRNAARKALQMPTSET